MMARRANDEGSIWRRATVAGRGRTTYPPRPADGAAATCTGPLARMSDVQRGIPVSGTRDTVDGYLHSWLTEVAAKRVRANTLTGYRTNINRHIVPRIGRRRLGKLTARDVRLMLDDCRRAGLSDRSVRYVHATMRAALEDAVREDLVGRNVAKLVRLSTPPRPETRVLSATEGQTLLRANQDDRLFAALVLLLLLGLRRSETLGLRWLDVDLDRGVVHIRQGLHYLERRLQFLPPKTRRSKRTVPLPRLGADALKDHRKRQDEERAASLHPWPDTGLVFVTVVGTPVDPNNFSRTFAAWCQTADVPTVRLHDYADLRVMPTSAQRPLCDGLRALDRSA